jgi:DnaA family protein
MEALMPRVRAVVAGPARAVLWLWGTEGCGRTHLLLAACTAASLGTRVAYLPLAEVGDAERRFHWRRR